VVLLVRSYLRLFATGEKLTEESLQLLILDALLPLPRLVGAVHGLDLDQPLHSLSHHGRVLMLPTTTLIAHFILYLFIN